MEDAYGDGTAIGGRPRFVGYVIDADPSIYHAGDTIVTDELMAALRRLCVDVVLLPINGRDPERESRGIVGNMDAAEAAELALEIGASRLVPYHWDGFRGNTVSPGTVVDAAAGRLHVAVPARFETFELLGVALRAPLVPAGDTTDVRRGVGDERLRRRLRTVLVPGGDVIDDRLVQGERPPA